MRVVPPRILRVPALSLAAAMLISWSQPRVAIGQKPEAEPAVAASGVRDFANLFSIAATKKATADLERLVKGSRLNVIIETVESLHDASIETATARNAQRSMISGLYILIDKQSHSLRVAESRGFGGLPKARIDEIRNAFLDRFKQRDFDAGLTAGVAAIEKALSSAMSEPRGEIGRGPEPLIIRNQVRLTLEGARTIVAGAEAKAADLGLKVNIAVADDGGHLLSFDRMDGARPASGYTALTKATTAATFRAETGPLPKGSATPDVLMSLGVQIAAGASGGKVTTLVGGVPILVDGQVIGGVGVGGAQTGEQDAEVAKAGIARLLEALKTTSTLERAKDAFSTPEVR